MLRYKSVTSSEKIYIFGKQENQMFCRGIKIADFTITKEIAMEYMKAGHPGYHMRPSRWKDIRVSVHI